MSHDLTDRFHTSEFMRNGPQAWAMNRQAVPFQQIIIHHTTEANGWAYGVNLNNTLSQAQEELAILALARDHFNRFGIGPGYNFLVFPSGRMYAVGKAGTQRRHTSNSHGRTDGRTWNYDSVAICAFGDYNTRTPTQAMLTAIKEEIESIKGWSITAPNPRLMTHREANPSTACPGNNLQAFVETLRNPTKPPIDTAGALAKLELAQVHLDAAKRILKGE